MRRHHRPTGDRPGRSRPWLCSAQSTAAKSKSVLISILHPETIHQKAIDSDVAEPFPRNMLPRGVLVTKVLLGQRQQNTVNPGLNRFFVVDNLCQMSQGWREEMREASVLLKEQEVNLRLWSILPGHLSGRNVFILWEKRTSMRRRIAWTWSVLCRTAQVCSMTLFVRTLNAAATSNCMDLWSVTL